MSSIPDGFVLSDGTNSFTATTSNGTVDITTWNLSGLTLTPTTDYNGTVTLDVRSQTTDTIAVGGNPETDVTESTDTAAGETEATGSFDVTFVPVNDPPTLDLDDGTTGTDFATTFTEGGGGVSVSAVDPLVTDVDDTTMSVLTISPSGIADGGSESLTIAGDGASSLTISLDGTADATQQITIGGFTFDVTYDGTDLTIVGSGGEMPVTDVEAFIAATTYNNAATLPTAGDRTLDFIVNDGDVDSNIATSTITVERDAAVAQWSLTGETSVDEGGTASYTLTLDNPLLQSGEQASVDLGLTNIDTTGGDYASFVAAIQTAIVGRSELSFDAGTGTLTYTSDGTGPMTPIAFSIQATDDSFLEGPEDFRVTISNATSATGESVSINAASANVTTTINDTDGDGGPIEPGAEWSIIGTASVDEGNNGSYTVNLSGVLQSGESTAVELTLADVETASGDYADFDAAVTAAVATYNGDAASNGSLTWDGTTLTFTSDGSGAMSGLDITLGTTSDNVVEGAERFRLDLNNPTSATGLTPTVSSTQGTVTTTIVDDEDVTWSIAGPGSIDEGSNGTFTLSLAGTAQAGEEISIDLGLTDIDTTSSDYADFVAALTTAAGTRTDIAFDAGTGTLTYTSNGSPMTDFTFSLAAQADVLAEGPETFRVELSNPASSTGAGVDLGTDRTTVTINDQTPTSEWNISGPVSIDEGENAAYTISLSGGWGAGESTSVQIDLTDIGTSSADYGDVLAAIQAAADANANVTFDGVNMLTFTSSADGDSMTDLTVTLPITNDAFIEGSEDFRFDLSNATSSTAAPISIGNATVTTTIDDTQTPGGTADGPGQWNIAGSTSVDEGADASYTVSLSGAFGAGEIVTVNLNLNDLGTNQQRLRRCARRDSGGC